MSLNEELAKAFQMANNGTLELESANGNKDRVSALIAAGADVHAWDDGPLRAAALHGHTDTVRVLLAAGADVHARNGEALRWAGENGHLETLRVLLVSAEARSEGTPAEPNGEPPSGPAVI